MLTYNQQCEEIPELAKTAAFLNFVMKKKHFSANYLKWQYFENPVGNAIAICAFEDDRIVGHYAAQPILSRINGIETRGLFILNAAVDPANQGKGLLRGIADRLHGEAAKQGFRFMIGVGNKNSTPIYTEKFGFRSLGAMDVKIGIGLPKVEPKQSYYFERIWSQDSLKWRLANPSCRYKINRKGDRTVIYKQNYPFLSIIMAVFDSPTQLNNIVPKGHFGLNLFLGIDPGINWKKNKAFINFPEVAKPSPLILIFRELNGETLPITRENILFRGIDFDAF
jgi:hypothetical protein